MQDFSNKIDFGSTFSGNEANALFAELETAVTSSGQSLDPASRGQLSQSIIRHAMAGDFLSCSGSGASYVLTSSGSFVGVSAYATGQVFRFIPTFANSGPATVDVLGLGARPLVKADNSALIPGDVVSGKQVTIYYDGTSFRIIHVAFDTVPTASSSAVADLRPGGRLTLASGTPVMSTVVSGATTLYYTPHVTSYVPLYASGSFSPTLFTEKSIAIPATTNTMYDVFGYLSSGTLALELLAWTNDTTRATPLTRTAGLLTKSGDPTRLYLGSVRTGAVSGQTIWDTTQSLIWNQYNRVTSSLIASNSTASWTEGASPAALQGNTTLGTGRIAYILGGVFEAHSGTVFGDHFRSDTTAPGTSMPSNAAHFDITGDTAFISQSGSSWIYYHPFISAGINSSAVPVPGAHLSGRGNIRFPGFTGEAGFVAARRPRETGFTITGHATGYNYLQAIGCGQYNTFYGAAGVTARVNY